MFDFEAESARRKLTDGEITFKHSPSRGFYRPATLTDRHALKLLGITGPFDDAVVDKIAAAAMRFGIGPVVVSVPCDE